jgi:hypothetical protein
LNTPVSLTPAVVLGANRRLRVVGTGIAWITPVSLTPAVVLGANRLLGVDSEAPRTCRLALGMALMRGDAGFGLATAEVDTGIGTLGVPCTPTGTGGADILGSVTVVLACCLCGGGERADDIGTGILGGSSSPGGAK